MLKTSKAMALRAQLIPEWERNLKGWGVPYPEDQSHEPALLAMFEVMPDPLSQDDLTVFYATNAMTGYNKQVRHLAGKGWDIRSGNKRFTQGVYDPAIGRDQMRLASVVAPSPVWLADARLTRVSGLSGLTWQEKLRAYKTHGCAVCGQKFSHYDRGHLNPDRGMVEYNIVPMCSPCNNWAQDRVTFELYGLIARPINIR